MSINYTSNFINRWNILQFVLRNTSDFIESSAPATSVAVNKKTLSQETIESWIEHQSHINKVIVSEILIFSYLPPIVNLQVIQFAFKQFLP